jgi:two-component system chemotaxis response regulator CheB
VPHRDIVCIGASAGGFDLLRQIARNLPDRLNAAVFVVLHTGVGSPQILADLLAHEGSLPAGYPGDGDSIRPGRIYVAPPDHHLVLQERRVRVVRGPKQNRHRPAIDVLFRSAAFAHGPRAIGVVLSGVLNDGAAGLAAIKRAGGVAVVQDPSDARFPEMPRHAIEGVDVDYQVVSAEIPPLLTELTSEDLPANPQMPDLGLEFEVGADLGKSDPESLDGLGARSVFTCPDCRGTLWEMNDEQVLRYRCHVGHGFGADSLMESQQTELEETLWTAVRAMEEQAVLARRVGSRISASGVPTELRLKAEDLERHADILRGILARNEVVTP